jgi:hypothetical protein
MHDRRGPALSPCGACAHGLRVGAHSVALSRIDAPKCDSIGSPPTCSVNCSGLFTELFTGADP